MAEMKYLIQVKYNLRWKPGQRRWSRRLFGWQVHKLPVNSWALLAAPERNDENGFTDRYSR
jgi:hypothetical protein